MNIIFLSLMLTVALDAWAASESAPATPPKAATAQPPEKSEMVKKAESRTITDDYVHHWISFPSGSGQSIAGGENTLKAKKGYITVVFFIASWDIKSQELLHRLQKLEQLYQDLATNFVYVFSHDTYDDAVAFAKDAGLSNGLIAGHELHKNFHHPKIPSIYVGDRAGWLTARFLDVTLKDIDELDLYLRHASAL